MWSEQQESSSQVVSGNPNYNNSSAAALLSYDVAHAIPWDWKVSLYTWTKGIASGVYLVAALLMLSGFLRGGPLWLWVTPILSGAFLAITGGLLIWDLEHPERFYLIFTRPQWRSWLVKGAFVIAAYSIILLLHFLASTFLAGNIRQGTMPTTRAGVGWVLLQSYLIFPGLVLATSTAIYTACLFAQAKARDMWQNPLLPPHLLVQALLLGSAALLPFALWLEPPGLFESPVAPLLWILAMASLVHLLMVWGEVSLTHATAHARLAIWEMVRGRYKSDFWIGMVLSLLGGLLPWLAIFGYVSPSLAVAGAPLALVGMMLYENAYVQAGQSVPLA
jgi:formate-dependent nitrite reductase membrane component NrfD